MVKLTASSWARFLLLLTLALLLTVMIQGDKAARNGTYQKQLEVDKQEVIEKNKTQQERIKELEQSVKKLKTSKVNSPKKSQQTKVAVAVPVGKEQVANYIVSKFGTQYAVNVATCESGLNQFATGSAGERGIFQIHPVHSQSMTQHGFTWASMYNWKSNIDYAYLLYTWQSWNPWSCARFT